METAVSPAIAVKSILTAFGGAVRFGRPPKVSLSDTIFLGAFLQDGVPMVTLEGQLLSPDMPVPFRQLTDEVSGNVLRILRRCLTPENIRICVGDGIHLYRTGEDPIYGVISDIEGVALQVDQSGVLIEAVPELVHFGGDDFDVVGHREFTRGILDTGDPQEAFRELSEALRTAAGPERCCRRYPYPGGGSALEQAMPPAGVSGYVIEYRGFEMLVIRHPDGRTAVYPVFAYMDEGGAVKTADIRNR